MPGESSAPAFSPTSSATSVFRIDKFVVPSQSISAFVERIHHVQRILGDLPGCLQKHVLTQTGDSSEFDVVTVVEWGQRRCGRGRSSRHAKAVRRRGL